MRTPPPDIAAAAQQVLQTRGVPASVLLAIGTLESAWFTKCTGRYNFFGIKAVPGQPGTLVWTHEMEGDRSVAVQQRFADYDSPAEAFDALGALFQTGRYAKAFPVTTPEAFCQAIAEAGYATDPRYADKLVELIADENFEAYDTLPKPPKGKPS